MKLKVVLSWGQRACEITFEYLSRATKHLKESYVCDSAYFLTCFCFADFLSKKLNSTDKVQQQFENISSIAITDVIQGDMITCRNTSYYGLVDRIIGPKCISVSKCVTYFVNA